MKYEVLFKFTLNLNQIWSDSLIRLWGYIYRITCLLSCECTLFNEYGFGGWICSSNGELPCRKWHFFKRIWFKVKSSQQINCWQNFSQPKLHIHCSRTHDIGFFSRGIPVRVTSTLGVKARVNHICVDTSVNLPWELQEHQKSYKSWPVRIGKSLSEFVLL